MAFSHGSVGKHSKGSAIFHTFHIQTKNIYNIFISTTQHLKSTNLKLFTEILTMEQNKWPEQSQMDTDVL